MSSTEVNNSSYTWNSTNPNGSQIISPFVLGSTQPKLIPKSRPFPSALSLQGVFQTSAGIVQSATSRLNDGLAWTKTPYILQREYPQENIHEPMQFIDSAYGVPSPSTKAIPTNAYLNLLQQTLPDGSRSAVPLPERVPTGSNASLLIFKEQLDRARLAYERGEDGLGDEIRQAAIDKLKNTDYSFYQQFVEMDKSIQAAAGKTKAEKALEEEDAVSSIAEKNKRVSYPSSESSGSIGVIPGLGGGPELDKSFSEEDYDTPIKSSSRKLEMKPDQLNISEKNSIENKYEEDGGEFDFTPETRRSRVSSFIKQEPIETPSPYNKNPEPKPTPESKEMMYKIVEDLVKEAKGKNNKYRSAQNPEQAVLRVTQLFRAKGYERKVDESRVRRVFQKLVNKKGNIVGGGGVSIYKILKEYAAQIKPKQ